MRPVLNATQQQRLATYKRLLLSWNEKINLIGPEAKEHLEQHVAEALFAAAELNPTGDVLDMGTGGGLPAIPMAIAAEEAVFHLVEADQRKWAFLKHVVRECELNSKVHGDRLENLVTRLSRVAFSLVTSRAVGRVEKWLPLLEPFLLPAARVALFEGSEDAPSVPGFEVDRVVKLPRGESNFLVVLVRST